MGLLERSYNQGFIGEQRLGMHSWRRDHKCAGSISIFTFPLLTSLFGNLFMILGPKIRMDIHTYFIELCCSSVCRTQFLFLFTLVLMTALLTLHWQTEQKQPFDQLLSLTVLADFIHLQHFLL